MQVKSANIFTACKLSKMRVTPAQYGCVHIFVRISHHPVKFGVHRSKWKYNAFYLSCYLICQRDQLLMLLSGKHPFIRRWFLVKFGSHKNWGGRNIKFFICHVNTWPRYMNLLVVQPAKTGGHKSCGRRDII